MTDTIVVPDECLFAIEFPTRIFVFPTGRMHEIGWVLQYLWHCLPSNDKKSSLQCEKGLEIPNTFSTALFNL